VTFRVAKAEEKASAAILKLYRSLTEARISQSTVRKRNQYI